MVRRAHAFVDCWAAADAPNDGYGLELDDHSPAGDLFDPVPQTFRSNQATPRASHRDVDRRAGGGARIELRLPDMFDQLRRQHDDIELLIAHVRDQPERTTPCTGIAAACRYLRPILSAVTFFEHPIDALKATVVLETIGHRLPGLEPKQLRVPRPGATLIQIDSIADEHIQTLGAAQQLHVDELAGQAL